MKAYFDADGELQVAPETIEETSALNIWIDEALGNDMGCRRELITTMTEKSKVIDRFLDMLNQQNCNQVSGDNDLNELFGKGKLFSVVCNKCGSLDIEIIGERGIDYGGETGYQEGSTAIKCNGCGSALTVWG